MKRNGLPFVAREFCHRQLSSRSIGPKVVSYDTKAGANQQQFVGQGHGESCPLDEMLLKSV